MSAEIKRTLLQSSPIAGLEGWETRVFLIEYPPRADADGHSHPVEGLGYVLEGTVESAFDDGKPETFTAGQSFVDAASFHRISRNASEIEWMRFLISYAVRIGEPNTTWPQQGERV